MGVKVRQMRASGLIAGVIVVVLGALMMAEGVTGTVADTSFMFAKDMNRGFEFVVGLIAVVLGAVIMDLSRS